MAKNNLIINQKTGDKIEDLTGKTFGRLTVINFVRLNKRKSSHWECLCDCGSIKVIRQDSLKGNITKSCGCLQKDFMRKTFTKHGDALSMKHESEHRAWMNLISRCEDPNHKCYKNYGGRGIGVCKEWKNSFEKFFEDVGPKPSKNHSIDRIDNNKSYQPGNVRWATWDEQALNRRNNVFLVFEGEKRSLTQWAKKLKVSKTALQCRLKKGWCNSCVLSIPFDRQGPVRTHSCHHR